MPFKIFPDDYSTYPVARDSEFLINGGLSTPADFASLFSLVDNTTINLNPSMDSATAQALIDAIVKDFGGHTLRVQFADGTYSSFSEPLTLTGFFNGSLEIVGNMSEDKESPHSDQAVVVPYGLVIDGVVCPAYVFNLAISVPDTLGSNGIFNFGHMGSLEISGCYFYSSTRTNLITGINLARTSAAVKYSLFSGVTYGIYALDGTNLQCLDNDDFGTVPDYGVYVGGGVVYHESGTVITGAVGDIHEDGGIVVPVYIPPPAPPQTEQIDEFTLDATDISNKYVELTHEASSVASVQVSIVGAPPLFYGVDFDATLLPAKVSWGGYDIDGIVEEGDVMVVRYLYE
jgi:hypothetical protein